MSIIINGIDIDAPSKPTPTYDPVYRLPLHERIELAETHGATEVLAGETESEAIQYKDIGKQYEESKGLAYDMDAGAWQKSAPKRTEQAEPKTFKQWHAEQTKKNALHLQQLLTLTEEAYKQACYLKKLAEKHEAIAKNTNMTEAEKCYRLKKAAPVIKNFAYAGNLHVEYKTRY